MAKQKGILKLKGSIGDLSFFKTQNGYMVREKAGVDSKRIAEDPAFQRTRENNAEFGRATKAGKILRVALRPYYLNNADRRMIMRLTATMMRVIKADVVSQRGERNVIDGEAELLTGFDFNNRGRLSTTLFAPYTVEIDREEGELKLTIAPFVPQSMIAAPSGSSHYRIVSVAAEVDFEEGAYVVAHTHTAILPWDASPTEAIEHVNSVTANSQHPLFLVVGVEFYQEINGEMYPLKNGTFNPLSIVKVDGGV
jgi:hypothetical protein